MLVALFTIWLLSGSADSTLLALGYLAEKHEAAELVLEHDEHREEALDILQAMLSRAEDQSGLEAESREQLQAMIQLRSATTEELSQLLARHRESRGDYGSDLLDFRYELKKLISREDWNKIFGEQSSVNAQH
jgi:hypothetical protein